MPIDFIKAVGHGCSHLLENDLLNFSIVEHDNGEITKQIAKLDNLKFELNSTGYLKLTGSLHKYSNQGYHNHNQFTFDDLKEVLNELKNLFELDLTKMYIKNLEIGVNNIIKIPGQKHLKTA